MRVSPIRWLSGRRGVAASTLVALATAVAVLPTGAPAGQSSQATTSPAAQIAAGVYHSCALVEDATTPAAPGRPVRCWGFSGDGQVGYANTRVVGDDEAPASAGPVDLGSGRTARALAVGDYHTCAVLDNGTVRCWGYANEGQVGYGNRNEIGDNETPGSVGPVDLGSGRTATAITAGGNHTCAVLDNGAVRCWGLSEFGQLGYGNTNSIGDSENPGLAGPVDFGGPTAKAITAGVSHTCAILSDDSVRCWGLGSNGQLGYGRTAAVLSPSQVGPVDLGQDRTARAITAGYSHTCAVLDNGSVRCWGLSEFGQLGYGNTRSIGDNEAPGAVPPVDLGGRTATAISAGGDHTCAVLDDGSVRCWGSPLFGQLGYAGLTAVGDNEAPGSVNPVDLGPGRKATAIASGTYHTCARMEDRSVRCWGNGADGRLGLCARADVGDDETPASVGSVDIGAGGAACPSVPPPTAVAPTAVAPTPLATPADDGQALRLERQRARALRACRAAARGRPRRLARCLRRFGRTPGRVATLAARADSRRKIILTFEAPGSDGASPPAARSYVVKQSTRPIRTARAFRRAAALCEGACRFKVTRLKAKITLSVTQLKPGTTYYYSVAARDNVSGRAGRRSTTVRAKAR